MNTYLIVRLTDVVIVLKYKPFIKKLIYIQMLDKEIIK